MLHALLNPKMREKRGPTMIIMDPALYSNCCPPSNHSAAGAEKLIRNKKVDATFS